MLRLLFSMLLSRRVKALLYDTCHPDFELPKYYGQDMVFQGDNKDRSLFWGFSHSIQDENCAIRVIVQCGQGKKRYLKATIEACKIQKRWL